MLHVADPGDVTWPVVDEPYNGSIAPDMQVETG